MQDSIIVYRNPGEKWFWEGGGALQLGVFILVFLLAFWVTMVVAKKTLPHKTFNSYGHIVAIVDGLIWAVGTVAFVFYF